MRGETPMTEHLSSDCPDFPKMRGDWRCKHNPPTGQMGTIPFLRARACIDVHGKLWIETLHDRFWVPSSGNGLWTVIGDDGQVLARGRYEPGVPGVLT